MKDNIVTANDVADATGQSLHAVARAWHELSRDQERIAAEETHSE